MDIIDARRQRRAKIELYIKGLVDQHGKIKMSDLFSMFERKYGGGVAYRTFRYEYLRSVEARKECVIELDEITGETIIFSPAKHKSESS